MEYTDGIGAAEIVVHGLVGAIQLAQVNAHAAGAAYVGETILYHGQHPEAEQINLDEAHGVEVVLLPLNDGALFHTRGLDWHHGAQRLVGEHEAADVNTAMPWCGVELLDDIGECLHSWIGWV